MLPRRTGLRHGCWVVKIDLSNRPDVEGYLDKHFQELASLEGLNLRDTKTSGNIGVLQRNTKLEHLNLANTNVFGDLMALQETTQLKDFQDFDVSNTNITCPQEAPLRAVLLKLGFTESQLKDLHEMDGLKLRWTLSCCKVLFFQLYYAACPACLSSSTTLWKSMIRPCNFKQSTIVFQHGAAYNLQQIFIKQFLGVATRCY